MSATYTAQFGHTQEIQDLSEVTASAPNTLPLHLPFWIMFTPMGRVDKLYTGIPARLQTYLGSDAFDMDTKWTNCATVIAASAPAQTLMVKRVVPSDATTASWALEATVTKSDIIQYKKTSLGTRELDVNGDPIPRTDTSGNVITEPGYTITWAVRELDDDESYSKLVPKIDSANGIYVYPILAAEAEGPGSRYNRYGFKVWRDTDITETSQTNTVSLIHKLSVYFKDIDDDEPYPTTTSSRDTFVEFSFRKNAWDKDLQRYVSLREVIRTQYGEGTAAQPFPFNMTSYGSNWESIVALISDRATELEGLDPYMVDLFNLTDDTLDVPYDHLVLGATDVVNSEIINYLEGGSDGTMDLDTYNELARGVLSGSAFPGIVNKSRYPITAVWDPGFELATKYKLIDFMGIRDDVGVYVCTHSASLGEDYLATANEYSLATALVTRCRQWPSSETYGTPNTRGFVTMHSSYRTVSDHYLDRVPGLYDLYVKVCNMDSATTGIRPSGATLSGDNAIVSSITIEDLNAVPDTDGLQQTYMNAGINSIVFNQHNTAMWPALVSCYSKSNSVLTSMENCQMLIYLAHITRRSYFKFVGRRELTAAQLGTQTANDVMAEARNKLSGALIINSITPVDQTNYEIANKAMRFLMDIRMNDIITKMTFVAQVSRTATATTTA